MQADPKAKRILDVLGKLFNDVANYIPADDRPDVTPLIEDLVKALQAPSVSDWKGHKFAPPFKAETVEWQYNNWQPSEKDVLVASFPKTGKICKPVIAIFVCQQFWQQYFNLLQFKSHFQ